jgi:hypothetical protein
LCTDSSSHCGWNQRHGFAWIEQFACRRNIHIIRDSPSGHQQRWTSRQQNHRSKGIWPQPRTGSAWRILVRIKSDDRISMGLQQYN